MSKIVIIIVAFLLGYFIISKLFDILKPKIINDNENQDRRKLISTENSIKSFDAIFSLLGKLRINREPLSIIKQKMIKHFINNTIHFHTVAYQGRKKRGGKTVR